MNRPAGNLDIAAIRAQTNRAQAAAADPATSAWVSANAGTGKTHVLTRRVLRLLLAGTAPERILCLTYTKAAAAEMSTRVFKELGFWVTKPAADLADGLHTLLGRDATTEETERARTLFARAIETPGGLKVQTIHAFAERLLQRFPLEAGVPAGFNILDDVDARQLLGEATDDMLREATRDPSSPLGAALVRAVAYAADDSFDDVLRAALGRKDWLLHVVKTYGHDDDGDQQDPFTAVTPIYRLAFGMAREVSAESIDAERDAILADHVLSRAREVLDDGGRSSDVTLSMRLAAVLEAKDRAARLAALQSALLTKEFKARANQNFFTKKAYEADPALADKMRAARDRFATLTEQLRGLDVIDATIALMRLADAVLTRYARLKARRAALDFDDLIRHTASLLNTSDAAQWVLYKLDGGLDHILVDESQDTSPDQWRIVESLAAEFFAGAGAHDQREAPTARTLFAVGDEKQSIYSFQGARPEEFARMGTQFRERAQAANVAWRDVPLQLSFRTVAPILEAVDRVFAEPSRTPGLTARESSGFVAHAANRIGQAGFVEIWEPETAEAIENADTWEPEAEAAAAHPAIRVAERIADKILQLTQSDERLASENRPITAGDILILVRKRNPFAKPMVSALKARGIPVAGADRLRLTEQIAVQDLVTLSQFLTLPEDDLALATVLKSPMFGFDDDQLLEIAHGRRGTLWKALLDNRSAHPAFEEAASLLREWRKRADFLPPYEFLAGVLDRDGMRQRLLARLGPEAADSIDELVNLAIAFDDREPPSLTGFLAWLEESNHEIKRDMEHGRDEVRIMTVHGAKGLEAPIVFLPDTCSTTSVGLRVNLNPLVMPPAPEPRPEAFVWQIKGSGEIPAVAHGGSIVKERERDERNRLLYVAMTRARDRLYVAGFEGKKGRPADCWYDLVATGLGEHLVASEDSAGRAIQRYATPQTAPNEKRKSELAAGHEPVALEAWAQRAAPREPQLTMPLAPSRLAPYDVDEAGEPMPAQRAECAAPDEPAATPPRVLASDNRFLRGTLTHALLEHLPRFDPNTWQMAATAFIAERGVALPARVRASIVSETLAVMAHPEFRVLFGPDSRAEVAISAEIPRPGKSGPALRLYGQIDRLAITGNTVLVIDYKTNRPPPSAPELVADAYLFQLAAYRLALAQLFPDKSVRAAILWTDGPRMMEIPSALITRYQSRLWDLETHNLDGL